MNPTQDKLRGEFADGTPNEITRWTLTESWTLRCRSNPKADQ